MPPVKMSIDRAKFADAVARVIRNTKPKTKDADVRQMILLMPDKKSISLYGTNESLSVLRRGLPCATGGIPEIAIDITKLNKVVSGSDAETCQISVDADKGTVAVKVGKTLAQITCKDGAAYREYIATPEAFPEEAEWAKISKADVMRSVFKSMLSAADPSVPQYAGVWTNGEGLLITTDTFRTMFSETKFNFGFTGVIPADFLALCESVPGDDLFIYYEEGILWARDKDTTIIVSCVTVPAESFPAEELLAATSNAQQDAVHSIRLDAGQLKELLRKFRDFFGESVICRLVFDGKQTLDVVGLDDNNNKLRDSLPATPGEGTNKFDIRCYFSSLDTLVDMFDGAFDLQLSGDPQDPLWARSEKLGVDYVFASYWQPPEEQAQ